MISFNKSLNEGIFTQVNNMKITFNTELEMQKSKLEILLEILKKLNTDIQDSEHFKDEEKTLDLLKNIKSNIDSLKKNIEDIEKLLELLNNVSSSLKDDENNEDNLKVIEYLNSIISSLQTNIKNSDTEFNDIIIKYVKESTFNEKKVSPMMTSTENSNDIKDFTETNSDNKIGDHNVLLISEKQRKVFLPYRAEDIAKLLRSEKSHHTVKDIIRSNYIVPISKYKNPAIARFRETYLLMKKREKASISDSLDMALGLTFNSSLHPAIITACKNLEELDTYLDCLELNQVSKFEYFKIDYEISPTRR